MGVTIIYLHEQDDGQIHISCEHVGDCEESTALAHGLMQGMVMLDGVSFAKHPDGVAMLPTSPNIQ